ncbi:MAG: hypothetical protein J6M07_07960 [Ruminococcus sp.]|nr:hypothetical protein [Ruminococcus sp.]
MAETAKKKTASGFILLNILIVIAFIVTCGPLWLLTTAGITLFLIIPHMVSTALCPLFYEHFKKKGTKRVPLRICRCVSVLTLFIMYISPIIGAGFTDSKSMYLPKREVFVFGVRSSAANVLPHKLPKDASEYYFRTGLQLAAQDYHPHADLLFRCGTESIDSLISEAESRGMAKMSEGSPEGFKELFGGDEEYEKQILSDKVSLVSVTCKYLNIPDMALYKLDTDSIRHLAEHGVCYGSGSQGCAFDRETGYAVYWG